MAMAVATAVVRAAATGSTPAGRLAPGNTLKASSQQGRTEELLTIWLSRPERLATACMLLLNKILRSADASSLPEEGVLSPEVKDVSLGRLIDQIRKPLRGKTVSETTTLRLLRHGCHTLQSNHCRQALL